MDYLVSHPLIPFISFTGSVANGKRVEKTAALAAENGAGFKMVGLELGGKDAAYVREGAFATAHVRCQLAQRVLMRSRSRSLSTDCDPAYAAENVVDGGTPAAWIGLARLADFGRPQRCSTRAKAAAQSSGFTCTSRSTRSLSRRSSRLSRCAGLHASSASAETVSRDFVTRG